ncbi:MAG TPA: glycosyltransferase family 1 protein [Candidatus Nitrosopelagicus sp.]|jgi:glycosyltransferase involved in cell wall biosynthesis|uniref:Glycosyltransferase family 4 protein n=1 Tax=Marine Group I thaumarchaeote TaxID=2511932 RepID=A0A7K4N1V2_9ARCH|nr:glycosyltransferase family 1 protein [Marine Group I thaumarchaeote]RUA13904.1 MAG: glycosyltransferase family 1 protein [Alphaproteobacteria bacterium]HIA10100.1 glycosyltransferase family 1 protein [Candidatus Nitrosopelagicus sp.]HIM32396.1 glycosyltransferase family 1 protein [Pelagibacteraceae bacterium]NWJ77104.1 glycosyltransferase family 4 protein [Marine Group I thaumarchaeote]
MKLLYISPTFSGTGGIGPHAFRVAKKLGENGFDVELMDVPHIPIKNLKNPSFSILGSLKALSYTKTYDAVHAWNLPSAFIMKQIKSKKKILSVHGIYSDQVSMLHSKVASSLVNFGENRVLDWADTLTTDSKAVQLAYKEKLGKTFEYLPAPLDPDKFKEIPEVKKADNQIVYVGRDSYEKGIDILQSIESKINGKVVYCTNLDWKEAMVKLKESSLLVVPSRMESIPQVIKEAFYLKVPVIATNVGGNPELVTHQETGILVPPEDPEKLTIAINNLLDNEETRRNFANNAFEFINNNFSWDVLLEKYTSLYES